MKIATWNVNSARSRVVRIVDWLQRNDIDVACLQETKCKDEQFPLEQFREAGYDVAHWGTSQWNGVAIVSRIGLDDVERGFSGQPGFLKDAADDVELPVEPRAISATCGGIRLHSLYIPNGRELGDPHMAYKLDWLDQLRAAATAWAGQPTALCGDFNVAPFDEDVWDPAFFEGKTHTSEPERAAFFALLESGFVDVVRPHAPGPGVYTYWDYTQLRFPKKQGMRIDFVLGSPAFTERVTTAHIDRDERKGKGASDHAPVVVELS